MARGRQRGGRVLARLCRVPDSGHFGWVVCSQVPCRRGPNHATWHAVNELFLWFLRNSNPIEGGYVETRKATSFACVMWPIAARLFPTSCPMIPTSSTDALLPLSSPSLLWPDAWTGKVHRDAFELYGMEYGRATVRHAASPSQACKSCPQQSRRAPFLPCQGQACHHHPAAANNPLPPGPPGGVCNHPCTPHLPRHLPAPPANPYSSHHPLPRLCWTWGWARAAATPSRGSCCWTAAGIWTYWRCGAVLCVRQGAREPRAGGEQGATRIVFAHSYCTSPCSAFFATRHLGCTVQEAVGKAPLLRGLHFRGVVLVPLTQTQMLLLINRSPVANSGIMWGDKDTFSLAFAMAGKAHCYNQVAVPPCG